mgnify:CR=1 FL=1
MKITVFTPTYNRAYIIENAFRSLLRQTVKDFEWIVVDDGSTDNTEDLFSKWIDSDNGFPIIYKKVPNGGKMRAVNNGLSLARGELFLNLDSDDYLTDNAIERILKWEATIQNRKDRFAGVAGLRCHFDGSIIGTTFKGEYVDVSVIEREKHGITGDRVEVFYTELFRRHPFPEFDGEKFISEGVNWMEICNDGKRVLRWFNEPVYLCEYREDGYSANSFELSARNPKGLLHNIHRTTELAHLKYIAKLRLWHKYYLVGEVNNYTKRKIKDDLGLKIFDFIILCMGHYLKKTQKLVSNEKN